ncbi:MAG: histidine kinase [Pseudomonadota bacterium]
MSNRIMPVTLAVTDREERRRIERMVAASYLVRLADPDADETGVLVYEPGESVDEDLPQIIQALESGRVEDVYLTGRAAGSDLLIRAMRSGIREFLSFPVDEEEFRAAVMRTVMRRGRGCDTGEGGRIVTVAGCKPGLGGSTLAASLAWCLNRRATGRTLLLDLRRPMGEIPFFLDLKHEYTWGHLMEDISRLDATYLRSVVAEHESGLAVLPGPDHGERPDEGSLGMILEQARQDYDFVVVDSIWPAAHLAGALPAELERADDLCVPLHLTLPCLASAARVLESIRQHGPGMDARLRLAALRVPRDATIGVSEAAEALGRDIAWMVPDDFALALSALNQGTPLVAAFPRSPAARAMERMAAELDHRPALKPQRASFLGSLFGSRRGVDSSKPVKGAGQTNGSGVAPRSGMALNSGMKEVTS